MFISEADIVVRSYPTRWGKRLHYGFKCPRCRCRVLEVCEVEGDELLTQRDVVALLVDLTFAHLTRLGACREVRPTVSAVRELLVRP